MALNLVPCFTPVESPESNGMAEAFVKTFKRDYVRMGLIPDAAAALALIDRWMEDYNTVHPAFPIGLPITARVHSVPTRRVSGLTGSTPDRQLRNVACIAWTDYRRDGLHVFNFCNNPSVRQLRLSRIALAMCSVHRVPPGGWRQHPILAGGTFDFDEIAGATRLRAKQPE